MKRILTIITATMLSVGAWAVDDLTLNVAQTVAFGDWGFSNEAAPTINLGNWASGGGWQFDTALSQDDYCGVDIAFNATTETHVTFFIDYEGGAEQSIDVPTGSTGIKADFAFDGGITKIGFKYGDWEDATKKDAASITITSAVVKAHSTGEVVELAFADLNDDTKDEASKAITLNRYVSSPCWTFNPALSSSDYEKVVVTFAEAIPEEGLTLRVNGEDAAGLVCGATKVTYYFYAGGSIESIGFFYSWNSKQGDTDEAPTATLKIAKVELVKSTELVRLVGTDDNDDVYTKVYTVGPNRLSISVEKTQDDGELSKTAHGTVTATGEVTDEGIVITLTPTPVSGYEIDKIVVERVASPVNADAPRRRAPDIPIVLDPVSTNVEIDNATWSFTMDGTMLVTATFVKTTVTAINPAEWSKSDGQSDSQWYDLQGRRIGSAEANSSLFTLHSSLKKGIYIINGKKIVIR